MITESMIVKQQTEIAQGIFEIILAGELATLIKEPGQFVNVQVAGSFLRRPLGVACADAGCLTLIYRVVGAGTETLSRLEPDDQVNVMGPLGQGFPIDFLKPDDQVVVLGGGLGIPPLYQLCRNLHEQGIRPLIILGFTTAALSFYISAFAALGDVLVCSDDGSIGQKGTVIDGLGERPFTALYACGPHGMLRYLNQRYSTHPHAYISLEQRMACGFGVCNACVCHKKNNQSALVCKDGPVFRCGEVEL